MCARAAGMGALLERDPELHLFERVIERAERGHGGVVLVEGQAGVGKTELLRVAGSLAQNAGLRVLRGRATELDRSFGFGVVRQLLERCVRESPAALGGGAESAAAVFTAVPGETTAEDGLFAHLHGLYWLAVNLAEHQPLLLLADDLHWADTASLRWLVYLAERAEDLPLVLICATRPAEPGADQALIDVLAGTAWMVRPAPLSPGAAAVLVRRHLPGAVDEFTAACHAASGGNAFLLGELLAELVDQGVAGSVGEVAQVVEFGSERVGHTVRRRLRLLPDDATAVARTVAVLGPPTPLLDEPPAENERGRIEQAARVYRDYWERRSAAQACGPRRATCYASPWTRPRGSEPADSQIARTKSSSPQVPAPAATGGCCPGASL